MRKISIKYSIVSMFSAILFAAASTTAQTVYTVNPGHVLHTIDEKVYGHFLEHIYNSVNNGLWGDLVWNRSLERFSGGDGIWSIEGDAVVQSSLNENVRLLFGQTSWQNYEYSLQAQKTGGAEGFLILFRANGENFYWCNLGGWTNTQHAIEKGTPGVRWGIFGNPVPGSIQSNRWYEIRIRCEGNHFRVWLDGNRIFDFVDNAAHLSGHVGVGTWITQARYRNFLVTDIASGDTLFSGLPEIEENEVTPLNWEKVGSAALYRSTPALNSNYCIKVVNDQAQEAGIQQRSFNLKSQAYHGSFWAKGATPGGLQVSLLKGSQVLAQQELVSPGTEWQEYSFQLTPTIETTNGTLRISLTDTGTVYLDQISMMGQDAIDNGGYRPDLLQAVAELRPPIIRWPGGCYASAYFWKDGIGPQHTRGTYPIDLWDDQDPNSYGTDEFLRMCEAIGAEPLIVVNSGILSSTCGVSIPIRLTPETYLQDALDWMEYCNGDAATTTWGAVRAANGHPEPYNVTYWEIDNETWSAGVNAYIAKVQQFAPAMRAKYPNVKIIACGSGGTGQSGSGQNWNRSVIGACADLIDYISTHHYENIANYSSGVRTYDAFIKELAGIIASSSNPKIKIDMSEWNVSSGLDWRNGLYAGGMLNTFERNGDVFEIGGPALFLRHSSANDWNNALINFNNYAWFPGSNYVVMKFWHDHYAPNFIETTGNHNALNVVSTLSANGNALYFKVINTAASDIPVALDIDQSFTPQAAKLEQIAPSSLAVENSFANPDNIHVKEGQVEIDNQRVSFLVPRYGAVIVTVSQDAGAGIEHTKDSDAIKDFRLCYNFPNPFNPDTSIRYELPRGDHIKLQVIDVLGRVVAVLVNEKQERGVHQARWDGKDEKGHVVSSGLYFCELITTSQKFVRKMTLLR
jgi:alpha-N-arabinofuranosidase